MMRLGKLERAILVACLQLRSSQPKDPYEPNLWRDELPGLLWGWAFTPRYRHGDQDRPQKRSSRQYYGIPEAEYRAKQAALTRALQTLYAKGLIDAGNTMEATGHQIYSARRAAQLGQEPAQPRDEATMRARHVPKELFGFRPRPWSYRSIGEKPRRHRNMKAIRLTEAGETLATHLLQTLNCNSVSAI